MPNGSLREIRVKQPVNPVLGPAPCALVPVVEPMNDSDYLLARAASRGIMTAMGDLYERHNRRVYAVCLRMTRNSVEAEDLTQEVFIHLMRKIRSFRGDSRFSTWLYRLTVNLVLMHFRSRRSHQEHQISDRLEAKFGAGPRDRWSTNARMTDSIALDSALAHLAPGCRSVFVLFDVQGYRHEEIARLLGCSVGTSKSQLHRARMKLKRLLRSNRIDQQISPATSALNAPAYTEQTVEGPLTHEWA